jgi:hypothetical protein
MAQICGKQRRLGVPRLGLIGAIGGTMALISYGYWIGERAARARGTAHHE